jgi:hypothetical protein
MMENVTIIVNVIVLVFVYYSIVEHSTFLCSFVLHAMVMVSYLFCPLCQFVEHVCGVECKGASS